MNTQDIDEIAYRKWLSEVDIAICEIYGDGKESLPRIVNFRNMFAQSMSAHEAAIEALRQCNLDIESFRNIFGEV